MLEHKLTIRFPDGSDAEGTVRHNSDLPPEHWSADHIQAFFCDLASNVTDGAWRPGERLSAQIKGTPGGAVIQIVVHDIQATVTLSASLNAVSVEAWKQKYAKDSWESSGNETIH